MLNEKHLSRFELTIQPIAYLLLRKQIKGCYVQITDYLSHVKQKHSHLRFNWILDQTLVCSFKVMNKKKIDHVK